MSLRASLLAQALLVTVATGSLTACATPDLGPAPTLHAAASYAVNRSFTAQAAAWPADHWWTAYGDGDLNSVIEEALATAPDLAAAEARVRKAQALAEEAGAARKPHVDASASASLVKQSANNPAPAPSGWNDTGKATLSLGFDLDLWGKNRAALAAAGREADAAMADQAAARLTLSTGIASTWADLARLYADRDAAEADVRNQRATTELMAQRAEAGLENTAAVKRAVAAEAAARADLAAVDESIGLTRNAIAALLGAGPDRGLDLPRPRVAAVRAFGLPGSLKADLIGRRPDIVAARLRAEAAGQRIKVAKADFYPNVNLSAAIGLQSFGLDSLLKAGSVYGSVGPAISLPIFSGGRIEGAYRGARADYDLAVAGYNGTLAAALQDVADVAVSYRALDERLTQSRAALAASDEAYRLAMDRYREGLATYLDVLSAEDSLISNRRAVADLETRAFTLDVALVRALGGGFQSTAL